MKKFLINFVMVFLAVLVILNLRFISAELKFSVKGPADVDSTQLIVNTPAPEQNNQLPLSGNKVTGYWLEIPSIGVRTPIVLEKSTDTNTILKRLEDGVVHYSTSPLPGEEGTSLILGHSSAYPWYKGNYGSVFALLGKLNPGDIIKIYKDDELLTYKMTKSLVFNPLSKDSRINQLEETDGSSIVLISCWPVGTNYKRIAVKADLVK
jgi:LPXTG-site transpeptidase (sortase) family protein